MMQINGWFNFLLLKNNMASFWGIVSSGLAGYKILLSQIPNSALIVTVILETTQQIFRTAPAVT